MVNIRLEFDSCRNCYLRCSPNLLASLTASRIPQTHGVILRQNGVSEKYNLALKADDIEREDDNVLYLNRLYGDMLYLSEGTVFVDEIKDYSIVKDLSLSCSSNDYSIAELHHELIEQELINQVKIVTEGVPIILFINSSLSIKFRANSIKPIDAKMLSSYTKVNVSTDDSNISRALSSSNCLEMSQPIVVKLSYQNTTASEFNLPELFLKCFCHQSNLKRRFAFLSKVSTQNPQKIVSYINCCIKCNTFYSNKVVMADKALSFYFQPNETVSVYLWDHDCKYESINLQLPGVPIFNTPLFDSRIRDYSIILSGKGLSWKIDVSNEGDKIKIHQKTELYLNCKSDNRVNPFGLVYESIVDRFVQSFPFSRKSVTLLSSNVQCYGAGKTFIMNRLKSDQHLNNFYIVYKNATLLRGKRLDNVVKEINELLTDCCFSQPAILMLDNLDSVLPAHSKNEEPSGDEIFGTRLAQKLVDLFGTFINANVEIIISCQSISTCHPVLLDTCDNVFELPLLSSSQQLSFLHSLMPGRVQKDTLSKSFAELSLRSSLSVGEVVKLSKALQSKIVGKSASLPTEVYQICDLLDLQKKKPITDHVTLSDCGGLSDVKDEINKMLILPFKYPYLFSQIPFQLNRGLLLFGPPGVGKTHIIKGIASELDMSFITVKGPELLNKYIGASEESVRNLFKKAEEMRPTLIFFDEFDSFAPCRGNDTTGVMDRVVNQLLTELDGVSKREEVFIIAATSRPDAIDPAVLRPGRIGRKVLCPMPSISERAEIWQCLLKNTKHDANINTSVLGAETAFYSGADIKAIVYNAQLNLVKEVMAQPNGKPALLTQEVLLQAISTTKPSLSQSDLKDYEQKYNIFLSGRTSVGWKTTQK